MRRIVLMIAIILCGSSLGFDALVSRADDPPQSADAPAKTDEGATDAVEPFEKVFGEWKSLRKQMEETIQEFRTAPPDEREAIKERYTNFVKQARATVERMRKSALAAFREKPNADPEVVRVLVGILANDVRSDDYIPARKLATELIEQGAKEDAVYSFAGLAALSTDDFAAAAKYFQIAKEKGTLDPQAEAYKLDELQAAYEKELAIRKREAEADDLPRVKLVTNKGTLIIELYENEAPKAVNNFISLVEKKYYDGLTFHRVLANFMAQGGCPKGDGTGGPGYHIPCECEQENHRLHFAGTLSMAHAGRDTGGSQFFITFRPTPHLNGRHTAFGRVIEGQEVLPKLERRDPNQNQAEPDRILKAEVIRKRDHEYKPTKVEDQ